MISGEITTYYCNNFGPHSIQILFYICSSTRYSQQFILQLVSLCLPVNSPSQNKYQAVASSNYHVRTAVLQQ